MTTFPRASLALLVFAATAGTAQAQRFPFERTFSVDTAPVLDVTTIRGKIAVSAGEPGRVVVIGAATVRIAIDAPGNAVELAKQVAAAPPIVQEGRILRLRPPTARDEQRAMTINYEVRVPPGTEVRTTSDSGETTISGVSGAVTIETQSASIAVASLGGTVTLSTGSGSVVAQGIGGELTVRTSSSSFTGRELAAGVHVRTSSGEVKASLTGHGDADVETGSSAIRISGLNGGLTAKTRSGRIVVDGTPAREWMATTGSSSVELSVPAGARFAFDGGSRSSSVVIEGAAVGAVTKHTAAGPVNGGGPAVHIRTGSGSIRLRVGSR